MSAGTTPGLDTLRMPLFTQPLAAITHTQQVNLPESHLSEISQLQQLLFKLV